MLSAMPAQAPCMPRPYGSRVPVQCPCSTSYDRIPTFRRCSGHQLQRGARLVTRMGIRAIENFDATFEISDDCRSTLTDLLSSEAFCQQVCGALHASFFAWCSHGALKRICAQCATPCAMYCGEHHDTYFLTCHLISDAGSQGDSAVGWHRAAVCRHAVPAGAMERANQEGAAFDAFVTHY